MFTLSFLFLLTLVAVPAMFGLVFGIPLTVGIMGGGILIMVLMAILGIPVGI